MPFYNIYEMKSLHLKFKFIENKLCPYDHIRTIHFSFLTLIIFFPSVQAHSYDRLPLWDACNEEEDSFLANGRRAKMQPNEVRKRGKMGKTGVPLADLIRGQLAEGTGITDWYGTRYWYIKSSANCQPKAAISQIARESGKKAWNAEHFGDKWREMPANSSKQRKFILRPFIWDFKI